MKLDRPKFDPARGTHVVGIVHTGIEAAQNFSRRLVMQGIAEGWIQIAGAELTLQADSGPLTYALKRTPGYYCISTGEAIPLSQLAQEQRLTQMAAPLATAEAQAWLAAHGKASGDYEVTNAYECELDAGQHERFRAVRDIAGNVVASHTLEG